MALKQAVVSYNLNATTNATLIQSSAYGGKWKMEFAWPMKVCDDLPTNAPAASNAGGFLFPHPFSSIAKNLVYAITATSAVQLLLALWTVCKAGDAARAANAALVLAQQAASQPVFGLGIVP